MTEFEFGGPPRYRHQRAALRRLIETRGKCALLLDPGLGKTAVVLDYASLLALKAKPNARGEREARVLVVAPPAALDTWALQADKWLSPQVDFWAEVIGGSLIHRAEALAARGGNPFNIRALQPTRLQRGEHPRAQGHRRSALIAQRPRRSPLLGPSPASADRPRVVLEVLGYPSFSSRARFTKSMSVADLMMKAVERFNPDVVVLDESHRIKGVQSNVSQLLARIGKRVPRRILLTGTPMPIGPLDIYAQWRFLEPGAFGEPLRDGTRRDATLGAFERLFVRKGGFAGRQIVGYSNLDRLQEVMAQNSIAVRKEEALDLPSVTHSEVLFDLAPAEARAYEEMKKGLAASLAGGGLSRAPNRLAQTMRLRQIASGFVRDDLGSLQELGTSRIDTMHSLIQDSLAGEKRLVVFIQHRHEIARLAESLRRDKSTVIEVITGDTPSAERLAIRQRFGDLEGNPERIVLVAQVSTVSLAVNEFVTASHAVFGSLSQRRDDLVQARDRLNRIGQTKPVTFWYVLARGTVDTVMYRSHENRTNLENAILEHIRGSGPEPD